MHSFVHEQHLQSVRMLNIAGGIRHVFFPLLCGAAMRQMNLDGVGPRDWRPVGAVQVRVFIGVISGCFAEACSVRSGGPFFTNSYVFLHPFNLSPLF